LHNLVKTKTFQTNPGKLYGAGHWERQFVVGNDPLGKSDFEKIKQGFQPDPLKPLYLLARPASIGLAAC
jgi:hypothetical protein